MKKLLGQSRECVASAWISTLYPDLRPSLRIPSHITVRERLELFRLAQRPGIRNVVEIGSYLGASATALAAGLQRAGKHDARIVCVDTWNNDAMSEGGRDTLGEFLRNTVGMSSLIAPVRGWSHEVVGDVSRMVSDIDVLFIDGDHSYEGCTRDWESYSPHLAAGGVVVLHDIGWAEGVQRLEQRIASMGLAEQCRLPNLWWGRMRGR